MSDQGGSLKPKVIKFRIPSLPASMNDIYYHIKDHYGRYQYVLKGEVRLWKTQAKEYVPTLSFIDPPPVKVYFNWTAVGSWYYKNGKVKKSDLTNLEKVLIDAVCEKLGIDDSFIWDTRRKKLHSESEEYLDCELGLIEQ